MVGSRRTWFRAVRRSVVLAAAVVGGGLGIWIFSAIVTNAPMADVHAYYDAGARLNAGQPLYVPTGNPDAADFYRYPPLLAILFRPLALLPYEQAAAIWAVVVAASFVLTIQRLGWTLRTLAAIAVLGLPIGYSLAVGQAEVVVTWLLAVGSAPAVAVAGNLKVLPALAAVYWVGRRDWRQMTWFLGWMLALVAFQFAVEPSGTIAYFSFLSLGQVGSVWNLSPYAASPVLWIVCVAAGAAAAWRLAPGRWGWAAAVAFSVLASPRLQYYQLSALLATLREPDSPQTEVETQYRSA